MSIRFPLLEYSRREEKFKRKKENALEKYFSNNTNIKKNIS
jgi:hypothetical protein